LPQNDQEPSDFSLGHLLGNVLVVPRSRSSIVALALLIADGWLMTTCIFPLYDPIIPVARDISTLCHALTLLLVAILATWRPGALQEPALSIVTVACAVLGTALIFLGVWLAMPAILLLGACLGHISRSWTMVVVAVSFVDLGIKRIAICVVYAFILQYPIVLAVFLSPVHIAYPLYVLTPIVALMLTRRFIIQLLDAVRASDVPADRAITRPSSYLPFGHPIFLCWFMFRLVYGYSLSFNETTGTPLMTFLGFVPLVVIVLYMLVARRVFNPDRLFSCALLLVITGLMLVPSAAMLYPGTINNILAAGVTLADVTLWFVLMALGSRNRLGAVGVIAWGSSLALVGIDVGAAIGRLTNMLLAETNGSLGVPVITATITTLMLAYALIGLKDFSFKTTIGEVQPDREVVVPAITVVELEQRAQCLAERHHLTPRETEVLTLLMRGRSINYITDELVVSRNTVKAHVKHIYTKLNVHTHQQIIDLVETS
jgi:DNA-binding CsgD family transcriptional regulator